MQRESAHASAAALPPALLKSVPRHVRASALGGTMMFLAASLVVVGIWGGIELTRRADVAARRVGLFASERVLAAGDVIQLRRRGGGNNHRVTAYYRYTARGRDLTGETTLRRAEREKYAVGSPVGVWYLPSDPEASWLDGYEPRAEASWPGTAVPLACGAVAVVLIMAVRRQWKLLAYGRPAMATVTKITKKRTDKGTFWIVHYEFTTMSGATRTGKYQHGRKQVPAVGDMIPIVHDRDNTFRSSRYPMSLVTVRQA